MNHVALGVAAAEAVGEGADDAEEVDALAVALAGEGEERAAQWEADLAGHHGVGAPLGEAALEAGDQAFGVGEAAGADQGEEGVDVVEGVVALLGGGGPVVGEGLPAATDVGAAQVEAP